MTECSVFVCTICTDETFKSFEELSSHMDCEHEAQSMVFTGGSTFNMSEQDNTQITPRMSESSALPQLDFSVNGNGLLRLRRIKLIPGIQQFPSFSGSGDEACIIWPSKYSKISQVQESENTNDLEPPSSLQKFKCSECGKELSSAHNLERHKLVHSQEKNFVCEFCGLLFKREDNLKDHRCIINEEGLVARVKRTKNQEEIMDIQVALVCPICGKSFANVSNLNKHSKIHEEKKEVCPECGKQFHMKASLKDHIVQIHKGGKMLTCPVCKKELKGRNSLFTHLVRFHPEQKNRHGPPKHTCPDCGRVFHQSGNLRKHRLIHSESLTYVCTKCGTAFKFPEQLRRHTLKHEMTSRHSCHMCDRSFTMEYELKNHVEIFHGGMTYICKYCSLSCKHLQAFRRHLQRRHQDEEFEWKTAGLAFLKSCRVANDHYVNVQTSKNANESQGNSSNESIEDHSSANQMPDKSGLSYLADHLGDMEGLDDNLISSNASSIVPFKTINYFNVDGKIQLDLVESAIRSSNQSLVTQISDLEGFNASLIAQSSNGDFKDDQESLISSNLANLAEFISFPVSDANTPTSPYMTGLDESS